jgi:hypothetical protein
MGPVVPSHEKIAPARFEAARPGYNALLHEALRRMQRLQQSKTYQTCPRESRIHRIWLIPVCGHTASLTGGRSSNKEAVIGQTLWAGESSTI